MSLITILITVIGGIASILAIIDYKKKHIDTPREELHYLKVQFMATRTLSISLAKKLEQYANKCNAWDEKAMLNTTIANYIQLLKNSQETNLSIKLLETTLKSPLTGKIIQSMVQSLEEQFKDLQKIDSWLQARMLEKDFNND
ncbi:hypothetical protein [Pedobacter glucosidilyticus]|uniref:hypothetical protein n=1 Tax=Pedobacter glucosidilyticus TaxID=1122941 RepID=UPI0026E9FA8F|nr:hypothetical protein [Pedobacter glucosidilyticus]